MLSSLRSTYPSAQARWFSVDHNQLIWYSFLDSVNNSTVLSFRNSLKSLIATKSKKDFRNQWFQWVIRLWFRNFGELRTVDLWSLATNLKRDTFGHFCFMKIPQSSKRQGVVNWLNLQAVPPYVGSLEFRVMSTVRKGISGKGSKMKRKARILERYAFFRTSRTPPKFSRMRIFPPKLWRLFDNVALIFLIQKKATPVRRDSYLTYAS